MFRFLGVDLTGSCCRVPGRSRDVGVGVACRLVREVATCASMAAPRPWSILPGSSKQWASPLLVLAMAIGVVSRTQTNFAHWSRNPSATARGSQENASLIWKSGTVWFCPRFSYTHNRDASYETRWYVINGIPILRSRLSSFRKVGRVILTLGQHEALHVSGHWFDSLYSTHTPYTTVMSFKATLVLTKKLIIKHDQENSQSTVSSHSCSLAIGQWTLSRHSLLDSRREAA